MNPETATAAAAITWISGPVLRARTRGAFHIHEAALVGRQRLLGEVIRVAGDEVVVQVYEDTTGLRPGDTLTATGSPLSVRLGPGLLGNIFDGLLRPLAGQGTYVQPGAGESKTGQCFDFRPAVAAGALLAEGAVFGSVSRSDARPQRCLVPPAVQGEVIRIAEPGSYPERFPACVLRDDRGVTHELAMSHRWPIRRPRPVTARTAVEGPLFTGQRVLDSIFPLACGGRAAMPGGFGTGKTVLQETLAKWCDADIIIYVGCGERGNEMAGVLHEFPSLEDPRTGRPLMERTVIIANTSNMPVSAREASIYTAVTVGEYFRDQGMRVALMADSTSRWAEALREVSGRLGELPGEAGYPAYLSSRLADFYERAAHVRTLGGETGSLSIIGAVSPPSADFSEPVTTHTRRYVRCFWALDAGRAQARFYPAVHPLQSYSQDIEPLSHFWSQHGNPDWLEQRRRFLKLLEEQAHLERMARIVGKDALPPRQQHVLLCAELINGAFLHQSAFSAADRFCVPAKQVAMMKLLSHFIDQSGKVVALGVDVAAINALPVVRRLRRMGEEVADDQLEEFEALRQELEAECTRLTSQVARDAG
ncbi:MAG TPA: V-type ATP synthase subunit A [Gammaproteobacteria bacterium]|nr:V-type ATP synthase subunit A [Gammaproteobacteria bacterium]